MRRSAPIWTAKSARSSKSCAEVFRLRGRLSWRPLSFLKRCPFPQPRRAVAPHRSNPPRIDDLPDAAGRASIAHARPHPPPRSDQAHDARSAAADANCQRSRALLLRRRDQQRRHPPAHPRLSHDGFCEAYEIHQYSPLCRSAPPVRAGLNCSQVTSLSDRQRTNPSFAGQAHSLNVRSRLCWSADPARSQNDPVQLCWSGVPARTRTDRGLFACCSAQKLTLRQRSRQR